MQGRTTIARLLGGVALCAAVVVGSVAAVPSAGAATPENTTYVRALYLDVLDRIATTGDDAGIAYWADRLEQPGQSRLAVVRSIMKAGSEYYGNIVDLNYALFLDRTAEPAGYDFYVESWRTRRMTIDAVVIALGGSPEYFARVGGTNASFVDAIYLDVLGREPDAAGRAYALGYITQHGRARYVKVIQLSSEKRRQVVVDQYGTFLGRPPTADERETAVSALGSGLRREDFDATLVASDEYYDANS